MKNPKDYLILALDTSSEKDALKTVEQLHEHVGYFKVGLELFTSCGPEIIEKIKRFGSRVFFDGKFMDIPNTASKAIGNMVRHKADMLNVYMSGGSKMLQECKISLIEAANKYNLNAPKLLGVTILTSMNSETLENDLKIKEEMQEYILHLAVLAIKNNLDGIICSPNEAKMIKDAAVKHDKKDFLIVTPGVRPEWAQKNDQHRTATPKEAILNGVSHIVVGRPITGADNPIDATKKILSEISEAIS